MHTTEKENSIVTGANTHEKIIVRIINIIGWLSLIAYVGMFSYMAYLLYPYKEVTITLPAYIIPLLVISALFKGMWIMVMISWKPRGKKDESRKGNI